MKKIVLIFIAAMFLAGASFAQGDMGARPAGMGNAFTGLADDVNAIFVNPAGIGYLKGEYATVSTRIEKGKEYTMAGGVEATPFGSIGVGYIGSAAEVRKTSDQTLVFSFGQELNEAMVVPRRMGSLSLGANIKLSSLRENGVNDSRMKADIGVVFRANELFSCGLTSGSRLGASGTLLNKALTWTLEERNMGLEWKPVEGLAVRAGREGDYNTAGFGIDRNGFSVDYAYVEKEEPIQYFSVSIALKKPPKEPAETQANLPLQ